MGVADAVAAAQSAATKRSKKNRTCLATDVSAPFTAERDPGNIGSLPRRRVSPAGGSRSVVRPGHGAVVERRVEDLFVDALLACDLAERAAARGRLLDDLGGPVVPDVGVERR